MVSFESKRQLIEARLARFEKEFSNKGIPSDLPDIKKAEEWADSWIDYLNDANRVVSRVPGLLYLKPRVNETEVRLSKYMTRLFSARVGRYPDSLWTKMEFK